MAPAPSGDAQIVFRVTDVIVPIGAGADQVSEAERNAYASRLADDLLDQLVARLQGVYPVTVDRNAIQQALSF